MLIFFKLYQFIHFLEQKGITIYLFFYFFLIFIKSNYLDSTQLALKIHAIKDIIFSLRSIALIALLLV